MEKFKPPRMLHLTILTIDKILALSISDITYDGIST